MKYITLEDLEKARPQIVSNCDECSFSGLITNIETREDAAYIDGWNDCITALMSLVKEMHDPDDSFLNALGRLGTQDPDDVEYPDCDECSFSGLLTDDD